MDKHIIHEVDRFRVQAALRAHTALRARCEAELAAAETPADVERAMTYKDDLTPNNCRPADAPPSQPYPAKAQRVADELKKWRREGKISRKTYRAALATLVQVYGGRR